jgi:archaeal flagellin FlaB
MWNIFAKDEKGFTGLEAAIVLIAFVVVAAVFSYVMLGAGFFTTQKSQEVVHTGVTQASSSVELSGDVIARASTTTGIDNVTIFLQQTSGGSQVDMNRTLLVYSSPNKAPTELLNNSTVNTTANDKYFAVVNRYNDIGTNDYLIDKGEKFEVQVNVSALETVSENEEFQIEVKPPQGATYVIHRRAPPAISNIMTLV